MTTNIKKYARGATEAIHYAMVDETTGNYPAGSTGTIANGSDESMLTYKGFASHTDTPATAAAVPIQADAGNIGDMFVRAIESSTGTLTLAAVDQTFQSIAEDLHVYSDDDYEKMGIDDGCTVLNDIALIINSHATSLETASLNEQGWEVFEIFKATAEETDRGFSGADFAAQPVAYNITNKQATKDMDNITISNTNYNRTKLRGVKYWAENPVIRHTFLGDGSTTTVTLDETPVEASATKIRITVDGVALTYTSDFTVVPSTGVVTFEAGAIPAAGEVVIISYEYVAGC